jgi:hypothetical protein
LFGIAVDLTPHAVVSASPSHARQPLLVTRPNDDMPAIARSARPAASVARDLGARVTILTQQRERSALVVGAIGIAAMAVLFAATASRSSRAPDLAAATPAARTDPRDRQDPRPVVPNVALDAPAPNPAKAGIRVAPLPRTNHEGSLAINRLPAGAAPEVDTTRASEPLAATLERLQSGIR